jgi:AsmA protein
VRLLKWVSLGLGALVALVVIGVLVIVWLVDPNTFKPNIETAVRDATGREFTLNGDIELGFFPWLSLRSGEGRFGNAPGFGNEPMLSWKAKLFPLLRGKLVADRVVLQGADLRLVRHADGSANWQGIGNGKPADAKSKPMDLRIDGLEIKDSRISFVDELVPRHIEVTAFNLTTDEIAPGTPFTDTEVAGVLRMEGFVQAGVPFRLEVPEAVLPQDLAKVDVKKLNFAFGEFEAQAALSGTLGDQPRLTGSLKTNDFDPRSLLTSVGIEPPKTTDGNALGKLRASASWAFDDGEIRIDPLDLTMDATHFTGNFRRGAGESPIGEFTLRGDVLDIARYIPPSDPASEPFVLPTAQLKALMFRGTIELERATLDDVDMRGVTLRLLLDEHGLRNAPAQAAAP